MNSDRLLSISPGWSQGAQTEIETWNSFWRQQSTIASAVNGIVGSIMRGLVANNRNARCITGELEPEKQDGKTSASTRKMKFSRQFADLC